MPRRNRNAGRPHRRRPALSPRILKGGSEPLPRCSKHGNKVRYPSPVAAAQAIERAKRRRNQEGALPTRSYRCPACDGWHLTKRRRDWRD